MGQPSREKVVKSTLDEGKGENELPGARDGRKHGGEGKGGVKGILTGSKLNAGVLPVLNKAVQVFKETPENRAEGEEEEEAKGTIEKQATSFPAKGESVHGEDVGNPQRGERVGLKRAKPGKTGPGQNPENSAHQKTQPPPPREGPRLTGGRGRDSGFADLDKEGEGERTDDEGVGRKKPPGKRRMPHMDALGREF